MQITAVYWWWHGLRRGDVAAILIVLALVAAGVTMLGRVHWISFNWGFGPDWHCTYAGQGDPVCIKETPASTR